MTRPLTVTSNDEAIKFGWKIVLLDKANPDGWELLQKASYEDETEKIMHTTKRFRVPGGDIYDVYTEKTLMDHSQHSGMARMTPTCSRSTTFVPHAKPQVDRSPLKDIGAKL